MFGNVVELCNAFATFIFIMNKVFRDKMDKCVIVYIDDILINLKCEVDHGTGP